jgi:IS30 family transposase
VAGQRGRRLRMLSPAERRVVWQRFGAGASTGEVMLEFGVSATGARRMRAEAVLASRRVLVASCRLSFEDREEIFAGIVSGESDSQIARRIGRHRSSVGREIQRCGGRARYRPLRAEALAQRLAARPKPGKLSESQRLREEVEAGLGKRWSPQQISARLKVKYPDDLEMRISHETIYQSLYVQSRGELRRQLCAQLRTGRTARRSRSRIEARGQIVGMVPIAQRPPEVDDRRVPGHWEGDLILGAGRRSAIATLVERQTRYVMLARLDDRRTDTVITALSQRIGQLPAHLARSLTWDQGKELSAHARLSSQTGIQVFFCDPHSPWQRGSNENTNGLLRQYLPKGTDLAIHDQAALDQIAAELNGRPRQTLGWMNPAEKMTELLTCPS